MKVTQESQPRTPCMVFTFSYWLSLREGKGQENAHAPPVVLFTKGASQICGTGTEVKTG